METNFEVLQVTIICRYKFSTGFVSLSLSVSLLFCLFHFLPLSLSCLPVSMFLSFSLFLSSALVAFLHVPHHDAYDSHSYKISPSYGFCYKFP